MNMHRRLDANETLLYFEREVESVKSKTYDIKYADLSYQTIFPASSETGRGYTQITYYQLDGIGMAKIYNENSKDIPLVNLKRKKFTSDVRHIVDGYKYNVFDVEHAAIVGLPLDSKLAALALRVALQTENQIVFSGDDEYNLPGLFSNSNIPQAVVATGAGGDTEFNADKTSAEIVEDVNAMINDVISNTLNVERPNSVAMPVSTMTYLATRPYGAEMPGQTILSVLKESHKETIKNWYACPELETLGVGGTKAMFAYVKDEMHMTVETPVYFEQMETQTQGFDYIVPCRHDTGGLIVYYPLAVNIKYGI